MRKLFFLSFFLIILSPVVSHAAITVTRGGSATINWHIDNASANNVTGCTGRIPSSPDVGPPRTQWNGYNAAINSNGDGSVLLTNFNSVGTFTFYCDITSPAGVAPGQDTITVQECASGPAAWDGSQCTSGSCSNGSTNAPTCNYLGCPGGTTWSNGFCATVGSLTSPNCTIPNNASSCTATISWNSWSNVYSPQIYNSSLGSLLSTAMNGNTSVTLPYSTTQFTYTSGGSQILASLNLMPSCVAGTAWDGAKCTNATYTATISGANCTVNNNQSTCTSPVTWSTTGLTNPFLFWNVIGSSSQGTVSTSPSTLTLSGDINLQTQATVRGTNTGGTIVSATSTLIRGICAQNTGWDASTGKCRPSTCPNGATDYPVCIAKPTINVLAVSTSTLSVNYNCNTAQVGSINLTRSPNTPTSTLATGPSLVVTGNNLPDNAKKLTTYVYTFQCYSGGISSGSNSGQLMGFATTSVTTPDDPTISVVCDNGSTNYPDCNFCPDGTVFDGVRCTTIGIGLSCGGTINSPSGFYSPANCGNGTIETGEECDGSVGVTNAAYQKCSNSCTLICLNGSSDSPNCGACPNGQVKVGGVCVNQCTNGALQYTAPACNACAQGQVYDGSKCVSPVCGNGTVEGSEQCDGNAGITDPQTQACTYGCCLTTPSTDLSKYRISCSNSTRYKIENSQGTVIADAQYTAPFTWTPNIPDTYKIYCINSSTQVFTSVTASGITNPNLEGNTLSANPKTIHRGGSSALTWLTSKPNAICKILAVPSITTPTPKCNTFCVIQRLSEAARLNSVLSRGYTDSSDPYGASRYMNTALTSGISQTDIRSRGKKSVQLKYSTSFISSCGVNPMTDVKAPRVKVQVTEDIEG